MPAKLYSPWTAGLLPRVPFPDGSHQCALAFLPPPTQNLPASLPSPSSTTLSDLYKIPFVAPLQPLDPILATLGRWGEGGGEGNVIQNGGGGRRCSELTLLRRKTLASSSEISAVQS